MSENLPCGDSVTLIETISDFVNKPEIATAERLNAARAALAVLELRESERSKGLDASKVGGVEAGDCDCDACERIELLAQVGEFIESIRDLGRGALVAGGTELHTEMMYVEDALDIFDRQIDHVLGWLTARLSSTTANSVGLPDPDPVESDRQSSESRGLGSASALVVEATCPGFVIASNHPNYSETPCPLCKQHWRVCDDCHARPEGEC